MKAVTIKGKSTQDISSQLNEIISDNYRPTLAFVFLSVEQDVEAVTHLLNTWNIQVFGATTAGEFIDGDIESKSIVLMLLDMNPTYFKIEFIETTQKTTAEDAKQLGVIGKDAFTNPSLIIASGGIFIDGDQVIEGLMEGLGNPNEAFKREISVFGGMAGDDLLAQNPLVFTNEKSKDNALLALILNEDKIDVRGIASCGWKAVGTEKTVTKSEGNIVYTIDDKPALDMLTKFLGVDVVEDDGEDIVAFLNSWYYPLQVERDNGDSVIRATRFANRKNRSLICTGSVPQGAKVKFSLPPEFEAIETVVLECESIKDNPEQEADALLMFSCVSRHLSFGALIKEEIEQVQDLWNAPMAGFFTYGEYGKSKIGKHEFHNNACCIVALKEKQ
ncbi:FIST signal transduction protein [Winogradskyella aurantia]|uniref:Histidine kinase n=1 Tax=Winogradskyella aurantia TaxID=1915063 RepID=A0A265UUN1_9FLAO|nr:FIST N-terminal domain-containing protein [Winogradskyella aurantia]OZV69033.1 hypothetical protein CA834_06105 [Winogradskyella aurantia]